VVTPKDKASEWDSYMVPFQHANSSPHQQRTKRGSAAGHKFRVGQTLFFSPSIFERAAQKGLYKVVGLLPAEEGDNQYRLKSEADGHERVVRESQLG
jgi:hypothetical protein